MGVVESGIAMTGLALSALLLARNCAAAAAAVIWFTVMDLSAGGGFGPGPWFGGGLGGGGVYVTPALSGMITMHLGFNPVSRIDWNLAILEGSVPVITV